MKVFLAGASGVIGRLVAERLVTEGHAVVGMTRSASKVDNLRQLGVEPVVCDVFDHERLIDLVRSCRPDLVMHQLTDLPDDITKIPTHSRANSRIRREGTANLLAAADAAEVQGVIVQSVAWSIPGDGGAAVTEMEESVLQHGGVVLRYGQFYGPGTYYESPPDGLAIHVDEAAQRTLTLLRSPSGTYTLTDT